MAAFIQPVASGLNKSLPPLLASPLPTTQFVSDTYLNKEGVFTFRPDQFSFLICHNICNKENLEKIHFGKNVYFKPLLVDIDALILMLIS